MTDPTPHRCAKCGTTSAWSEYRNHRPWALVPGEPPLEIAECPTPGCGSTSAKEQSNG